MNIKTIDPQSYSAYPKRPLSEDDSLKRDHGKNRGEIQHADKRMPKSSTSFVGEYYSHEKMTINYKSKDGDSFSFDYEKVEYQRQEASLELGETEDGKQVEQKDIKKEYSDLYNLMKKTFISELLKGFGYNTDGDKIVAPDNEVDAVNADSEAANAAEGTTLEGLPEYWNAENTSQRIFEFSTSFASLSEQDVEGYYTMMRSAIQDGYDSAMGEVGDGLSQEVTDLTSNTLKLSLEKLDNWAKEQGVDVESVLSAGEEI